MQVLRPELEHVNECKRNRQADTPAGAERSRGDRAASRRLRDHARRRLRGRRRPEPHPFAVCHADNHTDAAAVPSPPPPLVHSDAIAVAGGHPDPDTDTDPERQWQQGPGWRGRWESDANAVIQLHAGSDQGAGPDPEAGRILRRIGRGSLRGQQQHGRCHRGRSRADAG